jgi:hypothetical protein
MQSRYAKSILNPMAKPIRQVIWERWEYLDKAFPESKIHPCAVFSDLHMCALKRSAGRGEPRLKTEESRRSFYFWVLMASVTDTDFESRFLPFDDDVQFRDENVLRFKEWASKGTLFADEFLFRKSSFVQFHQWCRNDGVD